MSLDNFHPTTPAWVFPAAQCGYNAIVHPVVRIVRYTTWELLYIPSSFPAVYSFFNVGLGIYYYSFI